MKFGGTEAFTYDALDRLTVVSNAYDQTYYYNAIGNIIAGPAGNYGYGSRPHAVTQVGSTAYTYE